MPKSHDEAHCQNEEEDLENIEIKEDEQDIIVDPHSLNMISWILIGICSALGLFLVIILSIGCTRYSFKLNAKRLLCQKMLLNMKILNSFFFFFFRNSFCRRHSQDECLEPPANLAELSAQPLQTEQNIYLPLNTFREPAEPATAIVDLPPEDPPPAYHTLFPESSTT